MRFFFFFGFVGAAAVPQPRPKEECQPTVTIGERWELARSVIRIVIAPIIIGLCKPALSVVISPDCSPVHVLHWRWRATATNWNTWAQMVARFVRLPPRQLIPKWMFSVSRAVPLFCLVAPSLHCIVISSYPFSFSRLCWPGSGYSACPCPSLTPRRHPPKQLRCLLLLTEPKSPPESESALVTATATATASSSRLFLLKT